MRAGVSKGEGSVRNPGPKRFTPRQEEQLARVERWLCRARILQEGVRAVLADGEYCADLDDCAEALQEAARTRQEAFALRAKVDPAPYRRRRR